MQTQKLQDTNLRTLLYIYMYLYMCKMGEGPNPPAMDHNGPVSGPPLYHQHLLNDVNDGMGGGAQTLRGPARHLELGHLVHLARLQDQRQEVRE